MTLHSSPFGQLVVIAILLVTSLSSAQAQPDEARLAGYRLSLPVLQKMDTAITRLALAMQQDGSLMTEEDREEAEGLDDIAELYRSRPALRHAIESAGLSVDEFALCLMSWLQAGMVSAVVQNVSPAERDSMIARSGVPVENVHFYAAHIEYMQALGQRLQQLNP